jgi:predicted CXXCH cytochrome family protein
MKKGIFCIISFCLFVSLLCISNSAHAKEVCIICHQGVTPGLVQDWMVSKHSENDVTCSVCHGKDHTGPKNVDLAVLPDENLCAQCHEKQFGEFAKGKHNFGWTSMNAMPC